jgi:DNA-binding HxlR family transcriptional regulator
MTAENERDVLCPCEEACPVGLALASVGGKWKLRIICTLYVDGTQRFGDLLKKTQGVTSAMLSASLKDLEADGIVTRRQYEEIPPRVEYALTEHGRDLWPILHRLAHWAKNEAFDGGETR